MIYGLTPLGVVHTAISLVAVAAGIVAFFRHKEITLSTRAGQVYLWATILTCLTGFGIFQHGGFGKPHVLGIATLVVLGIAVLAARSRIFGRASAYVEVVSYSLTFFFHMIPGVTETFTRIPAGSPVFANADDPGLQKVIGPIFILFLIGALLQVRRLRAANRPAGAAAGELSP